MPDLYSQPPDSSSSRSVGYRIARALDALRGKFPEVPAPAVTPKAAPESPEPTRDEPSGRGFADANYIGTLFRYWQEMFYTSASRRERYKQYEEMDSGQIAAMLDAVVDSCLVSDDGQLISFKVEAKGAKVQTVVDDITESLKLTANLRFILRDILKYGDNFVMPIFDENYNIVDYENPPASQLFKFPDEHMRLPTDTERIQIGNKIIAVPKAYQQKNASNQTVAGWFPFECFHLQWFPSKQTVYSVKSFIEDFRKDWYKLKLTEEALLWHRITRSSPRLFHLLDMTGKTGNEDIKQALSDYLNTLRTETLADGRKQEHIMSVKEDLVMSTQYRNNAGDGKLYPSLNDIRMFDPRNNALANLPDVEHLVRKQFARVPSELVGILPDRDDITSQDIAASRLYSYCQFILSEQFLRPLFNLGLVLKGFKPEREDYNIVFPSVQMRASWRSADARFRDSMASANEIEQGVVSRKRVSKNRYGFTDAEWESEKQEILKEQKEFAPPEPVGTKTGTGAKAAKATQIRKGNNST